MTISRVRHLLLLVISIGTAVTVLQESRGQDEPERPDAFAEIRHRLQPEERNVEAVPPGHPPVDRPHLMGPPHPFFGRNFMPPALMQGHREGASSVEHNGPGGVQPPQIHRPDIQRPNIQQAKGPFAEDRKRIAALTESADRIAREGLPDVAHGLRERAQQLERELGEKQKHMQQEARQRVLTEIHERRERTRIDEGVNRHQAEHRDQVERGERHEPALRELHEQLHKLGREMRELNEKMERLTEMLERHHKRDRQRGHHEGDDDDDDDDNDDDDDDREMEADE